MVLKLLSFFYLVVINIRNWLYDNHILKTQRLSTLVVSIGNIIVGGSGKTPVTIYLAKILIDKGYSVGIVCRGYKKKLKGTIIVSDGFKVLPNVFNNKGEFVLDLKYYDELVYWIIMKSYGNIFR